MKLNTPVCSDPDQESSMKVRALLAPTLMTLLPALAFAHPGHALQPGFMAGIMHPVTGIDHLAAMLAVGMWAAQLNGRQRWAVPVSFVMLMLFGAVLGMSSLHVGMVEQGIAASVCVLGLLLAGAVRVSALTSLPLVGMFAVFHGYAHGAEAPVGSAVLYMSGFALSAITLHVAGFVVARQLLRYQSANVLRWAGAALAVSGVALLVGQASA
jgi:urease accessory protein